MKICMAGTSTEDANDLGYTSSRKGTRHDQSATNFIQKSVSLCIPCALLTGSPASM